MIIMLKSLIKINLIRERALQFIQIMSANGNKGSSPEKEEWKQINWKFILKIMSVFRNEITKSNDIKINWWIKGSTI